MVGRCSGGSCEGERENERSCSLSEISYLPNANCLFETTDVCVYDLSKDMCGTTKLIISAILPVLPFTSFVALDMFFLLYEFENGLSV